MRKRRFEGLIQEQPLAEGRWEKPGGTLSAPWLQGMRLQLISQPLLPHFHLPGKANPFQLLISPLLQGCSPGPGPMADV